MRGLIFLIVFHYIKKATMLESSTQHYNNKTDNKTTRVQNRSVPGTI